MGMCQSRESQEQIVVNRNIEKVIQQDKEEISVKLLLLGPGASGKSTILKQMIILHSEGFSKHEIRNRRRIIHGNIIESMAIIIKAMKKMEIKLATPELEVEARVVLHMMENDYDRFESPSRALYFAVRDLWYDEGVQACYFRRNSFQLDDCAKYFFDNLDRICEPNYVPSNQDILYSRAATSGVVEVTFSAIDTEFKVFDVGGQRSERRKWIHLFDVVDSIIFVAALSDYNMTLVEEDTKNRMIESINLFEAVLFMEWFAVKPMILFLNKKDIFEESISRYSLAKLFSDYTGGSDYAKATNFVKEQYESCNKNDKRTIYTHITCATDTDQVQRVIESVLHLVISFNMRTSGVS